MTEPFDAVVSAYVGRIDAELAAADAPAPDVAAIRRRAAELGADLAATREPSVPGTSPNPADHVGALSPFVDAYRERLDEATEVVPVRARSRRWSIPVAVGLAAAVVLVAWGVGQLRGTGARRDTAGALAPQASDAAARPGGGGVAFPSAPPTHPRAAPQVQPPDTPEVEVEVEVPPPPETPPAPAPSVDQTIASLDREARRAWKRGQLRLAERRFRSITKIGGKRRATEIAFAELFALVRQRGGDPAAQWRAYLRRFPKGRYAADARAGLCRSATGSARDECWDRYRSQFPEGKHRGRP